jgi:hypothetical protein
LYFSKNKRKTHAEAIAEARKLNSRKSARKTTIFEKCRCVFLFFFFKGFSPPKGGVWFQIGQNQDELGQNQDELGQNQDELGQNI